jgi:hypothetical protein
VGAEQVGATSGLPEVQEPVLGPAETVMTIDGLPPREWLLLALKAVLVGAFVGVAGSSVLDWLVWLVFR